MKFSDFLINKFREWNSTQDEEKTLKDFSLYLNVPPTTMSSWLNAGIKPRLDGAALLSKKLGLEVYDVLNYRRPDGDDPRVTLLNAGLPVELVDRVLAARAEYSAELSQRGIKTDSPEAREIIKSALSRSGIQLTENEGEQSS